jgi:hypothetical protein
MLEFTVDDFLDDPGLSLERQQYLALFEKNEKEEFILPTFKYRNQTLNVFHSQTSTGSASVYATYNASTKKFTFKMQPEYFDMLVREKEKREIIYYLRPLSPEFNFKRQIITNDSASSSRPKAIIKYVKYRKPKS